MNNDKRFWKSLDQYEEKPESLDKKKHEFLAGVTDKFDVNKMPELPRRKFLAALGVSAAFISTSCTDYRDKGEIVTYNKKPENIDYGIANYYASSLNNGFGVLVKTREGRPIKVDGNPDHPVNMGRIDNIGQASLLDMYDPGRLKDPQSNKNGKKSKVHWKNVNSEIISKLKNYSSQGKEIAVITDKVISPTQNKLFEDFKAAYPTAEIYSYSLSGDNRTNAWQKAYGNRLVPPVNYDKAKIILALESDFIGADEDSVSNIRRFVKTRNVDDLDNFSRLYSIEGNLSSTGTNADYRLSLSPDKQYDLILSIMNELISKNLINVEIDGAVYSKVSSYKLDKFISENHLDKKIIKYLVEDLAHNQGGSIAVAGDHLPEEVHSAVFMLNELIQGTKLYELKNRNTDLRPLTSYDDMKRFVSKLKSGKVGAVINFDINPVYLLPNELNFEEALSKAGDVITFTEQVTETSEVSDYILPSNHAFESWGDFMIRDGIISLQQPVISPLYNTRQKEAVMLTWIKGKPEAYSFDLYHKYMQNRWKEEFYPSLSLGFGFKDFWYSALHDGVYTFDKTQLNGSSLELNYNAESFLTTKNSLKSTGYTLVLNRSAHIGDGRYANNGWLQELPHPVTKVVWDNYASVSPATAAKLGVGYTDNTSDLVEVSVNSKKLKLPVMVQPGISDNVIAIELGYGRTKAGEIGTKVGFNSYTLMNSYDRIYTGADISKAGGSYQLVSTQEHHSLDDDFVKDFHRIRKIIRDGSIKDYKKNKNFIKDMSLMSPEEIAEKNVNPVRTNDVKWGMAIDMSKCVGCNLCVTSCNVENNIPVVGKTEVSKGREMHWMRIDRYYSGTPDNPVVSHQPMTCQHCDNAPCENVCPVVATTHSPDGLNQMTYNRCVGTRYCANNCPYKVRRFNFFDFRDWYAESYYEGDSLSLMHNPEVTVRSRGVMEKCTFCIQRIMEGRQEATKNGETFDGSNVKTACQESCPADAIVFGNVNDPNSEIAKLRDHNLEYKVLDQVGVRPNISYLGKLRNIHTEEMHSEQH